MTEYMVYFHQDPNITIAHRMTDALHCAKANGIDPGLLRLGRTKWQMFLAWIDEQKSLGLFVPTKTDPHIPPGLYRFHGVVVAPSETPGITVIGQAEF